MPGNFSFDSWGGRPAATARSWILRGPSSIAALMSTNAVLVEFSAAVTIETEEPRSVAPSPAL